MYLVRVERGLCILEVTDERGGGDAGWLGPPDLSLIMRRKESAFTSVDASTLYVEPQFHQELVVHGVRLPPGFTPLTHHRKELLNISPP